MKVTTLVPSADPSTLWLQLASLRDQTERPTHIVVADLSPDQPLASGLLSTQRGAFSDLSIEILPGDYNPRSTALERCLPLLERLSDGQGNPPDLFHVLTDGSTLDPTFYEQHFIAHHSGVIKCAVSHPWGSMDFAELGLSARLPPSIIEPDYDFLSVSSNALFTLTLGPPYPTNWLGVLSNATFRFEVAPQFAEPSLEGIYFLGQEALGLFLKVASFAPLGFIRMNLGQLTQKEPLACPEYFGNRLAETRLAFVALAIAGRRLGHLSAEQCGAMFACWGSMVCQQHGEEVAVTELCALLPSLAGGERNAEARFIRLWNKYVHRKVVKA